MNCYGNVANYLVFLVIFVASATAQTQVPPQYFGMGINNTHNFSMPAVPFGSLRLWDSKTSWSELNPSKGNFAWSALDTWLTEAEKNQGNILYTFGRTPAWVSSNPSDSNCSFAPGTCDPPADLNADGSGTDQDWKDFVTAIATHSAGRITYWETWNEVGHLPQWTGTVAQTVRMAKDAAAIIKSIDPSAIVLSPDVLRSGRGFLRAFLQDGGDAAVDAVAFHGYVQHRGSPLNPEIIVTYINELKSLTKKPLYDTELSWGNPMVSNPPFTDPKMQAGFVARIYLLQSNTVARVYWYAWGNKFRGQLEDASSKVLTPAGVAYRQVYNWMVGATVSPCSPTGKVWMCGITRSGGYQGLAVWSPSGTSNFTFPPQYRNYRDLAGAVHSLTGMTVPIGSNPILLEN